MPQVRQNVGSLRIVSEDSFDAGVQLQAGEQTLEVGVSVTSDSAAMLLLLPRLGRLQVTMSASKQGDWSLETFEQQRQDDKVSLVPDHEAQLTELEAEVATLTRSAEGLRRQVSVLKSNNESYLQTIERQTASEATLLQERAALKDRADDLELQVEQLDTRQRQLAFLVEHRSLEFETLSQQLSAKDEVYAALLKEHQLQAQTLARLEQQMNTADLERTDLRHALEEANHAVAEQRALAQTASSRFDAAESQRSKMVSMDAFERLQQQCLELKAEAVQLNEQRKTLEAERTQWVEKSAFETVERKRLSLEAEVAKLKVSQRGVVDAYELTARRHSTEATARAAEHEFLVSAHNAALLKIQSLTVELETKERAEAERETLDLEWPASQNAASTKISEE